MKKRKIKKTCKFQDLLDPVETMHIKNILNLLSKRFWCSMQRLDMAGIGRKEVGLERVERYLVQDYGWELG